MALLPLSFLGLDKTMIHISCRFRSIWQLQQDLMEGSEVASNLCVALTAVLKM